MAAAGAGGGAGRSGARPAEPAAGEVLRGYLAAQSTAFLAQLPRLRQGDPEAAHRIRVASRRARSMLRTFRPLLDEEWADALAERLAKFTAAIGPGRDVEVVRQRLLAGFDALGGQDAGVVRARNLVDRMLQREATAARESTLAILAGPGFHALADQIALAPAALPVRDGSREPATEVLYPLVGGAFEAVEQRVRGLPEVEAAEVDGWGGFAGSALRSAVTEVDSTRAASMLVAAGVGVSAGAGRARVGAGGGSGAAGASAGAGAGSARPARSRSVGVAVAAAEDRGRNESIVPGPAAGPDEQAEDEIWHQLRISAKRARYAAEVCVPLAGPAATGLADQLARMTEALGRQQDAATASAVLSRAAQTPRIVAPTAFALGRLLGAQRARITRDRCAFPALWAQVSAAEHRTWLR